MEERHGDFFNSIGRIGIPSSSGYGVVHIKKVFKGQLKYRTTHLYDDSWFHRCYNFLSSCEYSNRPRESWYDDAIYEGVSADGKWATFQYGPVPTTNRSGMYFGRRRRLANWVDNEWKNLPVGVQVK
jgi:hypothetical protein